MSQIPTIGYRLRRPTPACLVRPRCAEAGTLLPSSVNGDIAIQWEWSNFDPSQNLNPLTDYDKTLHNWLRPRVEHVTQNLWRNTWNIRPLFFIFIFPRAWILAHNVSKYAFCDVRKCLFGVHTMADNIWGSDSPKTVKNGLLLAGSSCHEQLRDEWRHRRVTSLASFRARSPYLAERRILFIVSWESPLFCIFQWLQRNDSVSWCTIFGKEIQFLQNLYSICRQSVLQVVVWKITYAVVGKLQKLLKLWYASSGH